MPKSIKKMKNFTSIHDVSNVEQLVQQAFDFKKTPLSHSDFGKGKTLGMVFFNPSLRTRMSTQKAAQNLGMSVISLNVKDGWQLEFEDQVIMNGDKAEHIKEAVAVMSQFVDVLAVRSFPSLVDKEKDYADFVLQKFIQYSSVPILSLESAIRHPLQSLTDLMTIKEHQKNNRPKMVLTWAPHPKALPQAVANSFVEWMDFADMDLTITHPKGYELAPEFSKNATIEYDQNNAFTNADFIYAKNWSSFNDYGKILSSHEDWQVTSEKMVLTNNGKFMHCLPVRRNVVVADSVLDSPSSLTIQQTHNRTFAAQSVLFNLLNSPVKVQNITTSKKIKYS